MEEETHAEEAREELHEESTTQERNLDAVHLLMTYRCTRSCSHCFHFGSPNNEQVMTAAQLKRYLKSIKSVPSVKWIFFEGGEPTLYFPLLIEGLKVAHEMGFHTAVVTNGFWIPSIRDMIPWLRQFRDVHLNLLQISVDELHENTRLEPLQRDIVDAAGRAGMLCQFLGVSEPAPDDEPLEARRGATIVDGEIVYRGRAAHLLVEPQSKWLWSSFDECPHENLMDPYRIHVEVYGHVMVCDGISIGNLGKNSLHEILEAYTPEEHPIVGPLLEGGPAQLATTHEVKHKRGYVDACHLCYGIRRQLRKEFPRLLSPGILYGQEVSGKKRKTSRGGRGARGGRRSVEGRGGGQKRGSRDGHRNPASPKRAERREESQKLPGDTGHEKQPQNPKPHRGGSQET